MSGNVFEWTNDWLDSYSETTATDPKGPSSSSYRLIRGGAEYAEAKYATVTYRTGGDPGGGYYLGLRLAWTSPAR